MRTTWLAVLAAYGLLHLFLLRHGMGPKEPQDGEQRRRDCH